jgi:hypothetical protein
LFPVEKPKLRLVEFVVLADEIMGRIFIALSAPGRRTWRSHTDFCGSQDAWSLRTVVAHSGPENYPGFNADEMP